ncbi:hypothetical protein TNCV_1907201 [Trichonephila clavipes]|nr:hypothetical protein TNCV_1907201 [Trichonephila clavipes]
MVNENPIPNFGSSRNFAGLCWTTQMPPSQELDSQDITRIRWKGFTLKPHTSGFPFPLATELAGAEASKVNPVCVFECGSRI